LVKPKERPTATASPRVARTLKRATFATSFAVGTCGSMQTDPVHAGLGDACRSSDVGRSATRAIDGEGLRLRLIRATQAWFAEADRLPTSFRIGSGKKRPELSQARSDRSGHA
jgi:hypothetical protein